MATERLVAQMVVRNEADRYLDLVLSRLSEYADEIVITDDASTDGTVEICKQYTDLVYVNDEHLFSTNEGRLRQTAWDNLERHAKPRDWILCIDADEVLWWTTQPLDHYLYQTKFDILGLLFVNMWDPKNYRVDGYWEPTLCSKLFRFRPGGKIKDRPLACGSEPTYVEERLTTKTFMRHTGLVLQHLGYMRDEDKQAKYDRYMTIDRGKYHNLRHLRSIVGSPMLKPWSQYQAKEVTHESLHYLS